MHRRVAVIGYSFKFPQTSRATFWQDLLDKKDLVTEVDPSRWSHSAYLHDDPKHPGTSYTFKAGSIGDITGFDAEFFGISPREAAYMDPQQRLLLEMTWEAMEHAGLVPSKLRKTNCGVFIGISSSDYAFRMADDMASVTSTSGTGNTSSIASNRISYQFDLRGPSITMDTACSSSMVTFHQACQSILSGEVNMAVTGGINLHLHPYGFISFAKATMLSPDGRCKVFDKSANGYVRSEGGGIFLLKDYDQAVADKDTIHAIVAASTVNTDGNKSGLTIPSCEAQIALMQSACQKAGITSDEVDYVEAHGTGTPVGDPIETRAIGKALGQDRSTPMPIGSIKSNMGHLETAAGVAGIAKALYAIQHRCVPATISMKTPNPAILFDEWNIRVVNEHLNLKPEGTINIGINSFGFGGANGHVILQSPPTVTESAPADVSEQNLEQAIPLIVSAETPEALQDSARNMAEFFQQNDVQQDDASLYNSCWTAFNRRERHPHCLLLKVKTSSEAVDKLSAFAESVEPQELPDVNLGSGLKAAQGPVFVYSGNGCQWEKMGNTLLDESPTFLNAVTEVEQLFAQYSDFSLLDEIRGLNGENRLQYTEIAQPVLFALQVGVTTYLREQNITPIATIGHSVGEVAAAWACGALPLASAVKVIYYRSKYQGKTKNSGQMTATGLGQQELEKLLQQAQCEQVNLAGINSYRGTTLAGNPQQLSQIEALLESQGAFYKRLPLDYAFHSPSMDLVAEDIRLALADLKLTNNTIPFISTVTGSALAADTLNAEYWWDNIRKPVQFQQGVDNLIDQGMNCFIEIGAHPILRGYLQDQLRAKDIESVVITTICQQSDTLKQLEEACAQTIIAGAVDPRHWFPLEGKLAELPAYPWQREHLWHSITSESCRLLYRSPEHPLLGYPVQQHCGQWENQLDCINMPWLADHVVGETTLFPGSGFVELAMAATAEVRETEILELEDLEIFTPLVLSEQQTKVVRSSIDAASGKLRIESRDLVNSDQWTPHVTARATQQNTGKSLQKQTQVLPDRPADFEQSQHRLLTQSTGLDYGPAFSAIERGWVNDNEVIALLNQPEQIRNNLDQYYLHPAMLDCTFQLVMQLLGEQLDKNCDIAFVPTRFGRIHINRNGQIPHLAKAILVRRAPHSIVARFELFDQHGQAIALLDEVRFKAVQLRKKGSNSLDFLDYHLTPVPRQFNSDTTLLQVLGKAFATELRETQAQQQRYNLEVEPLLEHMMLSAFRESLACLAKDSIISHTAINQLNQKNPDHQALRKAIFSRAEQFGIIESHKNYWSLVNQTADEQIGSQLIWNTLTRDYPDFFPAIHLAGRVCLHLQDLIQGNTTAAQLGISSNQYGDLLKKLRVQTSYSAIRSTLQQSIREGIASLQPGNRLRVLEISSKQPEFAVGLCEQFDFTRADYVFGSHDPEATESVLQLQKSYPLLECMEISDAEQDAQRSAQPFQLAIINLDHPSPAYSLQLIRQIKPLLSPAANVIFIGHQPSFWLDIALGSDPNWWPQDQSTAQLSANRWVRELQQQGFSKLQVLSTDGNPAGSYQILAAAPVKNTLQQLSPERLSEQLPNKLSEGPPEGSEQLQTPQPLAEHHRELQHWLILASKKEQKIPAVQLMQQQLLQAGDAVSLSTLTAREPLTQLLLDNLEQGNAITQIVHCSELYASQELLSHQTSRCTLATEIAMATELAASSTPLWILTQGVGAALPCDQPTTNQSGYQLDVLTAVPADAALWGFGRTLMNEVVSGGIRLIDLPQTFSAAAVQECVMEMLTPSTEKELVISADGERFAPRLRLEPIPTPQPATTLQQSKSSSATPRITLGFQLPGQLRNLRWFASASPALARNELEIEVKASGLNFRDVMYTLGLLSDEAIENGFSGATLGLEFAGTVLRAGNDVTQYQPGDAVVGFGPASFSNRVITTTNTIAKIPDSISFEGAATIPTTFFTVYYSLQHLARMQPGERILIHGAAGGVGIAAIQIAQWIGAEIYATAGSDEKRDFLRLMGVEHIYDSRALTFAEEILQDTPDSRGVDVVLNSLAGEAINQNFRVLKPFGRFLELGKRDFYENTQIGLRPFRNNISYFGIDADQLMYENPELTHRLFNEMMELFQQQILYPLPYTCFDADQVVEAFRYMQQARQIGKVVVSYEQGISRFTEADISTPEKPLLQLNPNGSYLVTGGLGGFGLRTAQWLIEKGACHLILLSRRGASSEEAKESLAEFADQGINVQAVACDVTDRSALEAALSKSLQQMPPLKGLVHAATLIEDNLIKNLDRQQIERSFSAKMLGAQHLHELTLDMQLEFFVLYSSATTLLGNPGQSSYIAANHWLEALAAFRRQQGLAATCVRWGPIDDVGFLSRNEQIKDALQNRMGGQAIDSAQGLAIMEQMILADSRTLSIMEMDWNALHRFLPTSSDTKFREIALAAPDTAQSSEGLIDLEKMIAEMSEEELHDAIVDILKAELSKILLIAEKKIDPARSMYDIGMDSLMGVELMAAIESQLGIKIPVMALTETPSLNKLADRLISQVKGTEEKPASEVQDTARQMAELHGSNKEQAEELADTLNLTDTAVRVIH